MSTSKTTHPARYRARYRVYQFFAALKAGLPTWAGGVRNGLTENDQALLISILTTPAQQHLFSRMSPNDQSHAIAVARTLQQADHRDQALMQAALLHDVGKSISQPIIHRVLIVLFAAFWPAALQWLSRDTTNKLTLEQITWWRRPFVIHAHHPTIGAEWAEQADCDPLAVDLIARHEEKADPQDKLRSVLQWADNLN
jgi:putative nucleotidyltransferase with HDIG domain